MYRPMKQIQKPLELLPVVWLFGDNDDYVGQTMKTDPLFQLDAHVTRDLTEHFWAAVDASWYYGGKATINGVPGEKLNSVGVGLTLGYQINDNLNLTVGYKTTVDDSGAGDLQMDYFMVTLVYGWHARRGNETTEGREIGALLNSGPAR